MKVFLIGCGDIARHHGRAVVRLGGEVIGGFDISETSAKLVSQEFGCPTCAYGEIEDSVVKADYVVISTPPTKRLDYVEMVLKHHIPLYMEKPVACTMEDAMKIKAMADQYDAKIMVGFAHYYRPAYRKMLELVKTGMFGEPVDIAFSRLSPGFGFHAKNLGASWRTDPNLACGMTVESVSHDWKLITAMAGGFDTIACNYAGTIASVPKFDNHTSITIRLRNGAIGTIAASWACDIPTCSRAYIGTKGSIFLTGEGMFEFTKLTWKTEDMPYAESIQFNDSYDRATGDVIYYAHEAFQKSLREGAAFETPLSDGISALIYSLAAKKSSEEQITVKVPDWGQVE
ncbi:MAG: Gfo/Idh/MocA family oxidoreductase [Eubacteriales bacterium]|nr:Gfo/Idh/MocA family oxidoreductase [Eubacteriales bacterium]